MSASKITISIDQDLLAELDHLIEKRIFSSRSQAIQMSVSDKLTRMRRSRLAEECAKLDPAVEKAMAEGQMELAAQVYQGLSERDIRDIERIALDRGNHH